MILIFSEIFDYTTYCVIDWLLFCKVDFILINNETKIEKLEVQLGEYKQSISIRVHDNNFKLEDIKAIWYRRDGLIFNADFDAKNYPKVFVEYFRRFIFKETTTLKTFIYGELSNKYRINSFKDECINKLTVLKVAAEAGLTIPETTIGPNDDLTLHSRQCINKPIGDVISFYYDDYMCFLRTQYYTPDHQNSFPTLIQQHVSKIFEVRVFYLYGEFFSMAMFSQASSYTLVDYRNYNYDKPVRAVPFQLPTEIEHKIKILMKNLQLDSGSVDLIYSSTNQFVFLEVNPLGQFSNVSYTGNYYIEKHIAEILCHE